MINNQQSTIYKQLDMHIFKQLKSFNARGLLSNIIFIIIRLRNGLKFYPASFLLNNVYHHRIRRFGEMHDDVCLCIYNIHYVFVCIEKFYVTFNRLCVNSIHL